jgi:diadenosine tetraphosphatase ApaH/serine/threonine PP2A family protein phosphatase
MNQSAGAKNFDLRSQQGPFDIIGDVHGCIDELEALLTRLGYSVTWTWQGQWRVPDVTVPSGRRVIFVGDLVDRGPGALEVITLTMTMCARGQALCVPGNHDVKFRRWLDGHHVTASHGLEITIADFELITAKERATVSQFIKNLPPYLWLDEGHLVVAHAGIQADMIGFTSHKIENFCLYGDVDSGKTPRGLPIRYNWAARYNGAPLVVYGHVCVEAPTWVNGTVCIDTGCCFGGRLTALRYPERETVSVPASRTHFVREGGFGLPPAR